VADLREVAAELAATLPEPVLLLGSTPEDAGDLDLLVRPAAEAALLVALPAAGFARLGHAWLRVAGGTTAAVELAPAAGLGLDAASLQRLFDAAVPLPGLAPLTAPAPAHVLLLLARRALASGGRLDARRLARARAALTEDPDALAAARADAALWRCEATLELVAAHLEGRVPDGAARRAALEADGVAVPAVWRDLVRPMVPRRGPRGVVLAVSGLDGSGKSTLTAGLVQALDALDVPHVVLWHRLSYGRLLVLLAAPVKTLVRVLGRRRADAGGRAAAAEPARPKAAGHGSQEPAPGGGRLWPLVVTLVHVLTAGPATRWHLRRGRVVVRDRYVLDALVHLAVRYGAAAPARLHLPLLRGGLPAPVLAWFLDVPAEEARRRKPEQFTVQELAQQRAEYLRLAPLLRVVVLDGARLPHELQDDAVHGMLAALRTAHLLSTDERSG
jgi:thymidylate kinase